MFIENIENFVSMANSTPLGSSHYDVFSIFYIHIIPLGLKNNDLNFNASAPRLGYSF